MIVNRIEGVPLGWVMAYVGLAFTLGAFLGAWLTHKATRGQPPVG